MVGGFVKGVFYPLRGFGMILTDAKLLVLSVIPVGLGVLLYGLLAWVMWRYSGQWFDRLWPHADGGRLAAAAVEALRWVAYLLFLALVFLMAVVSFITVTRIVGGPFFDALSLRTEVILDPSFVDPGLGPSIFGEAWIEFEKLVIGLVLWVVCMAMNLVVPLSGVVLGLALGWYFLGQEFLSYSMARRGLGKVDRKAFFRRNFGACAGFALATFFLLMVPLLPLVLIPACVVGGTLLYHEGSRARP